VADVPADLLRALYGASEAVIPPSKCTIWRVVTGVDCAALDAAIGAWPARRAGAGTGEDEPAATALFALIVDGKTVRGAVAADGTQVHLLAAATHEHALVLAQTDVSAKTNEIPMFAPLLDTLDITGAVITADALHTQRRHADYLHRRNAHYVFCVKDNQPGLFDALDALDWKQVPVTHTSTCRGHGRVETRALQVMPAPPDLPFPHVQQVFLVEREVTDLARNALSNVAIFGITSLGSDRAGPATLAALTRGHWGIESLHWIRDTLYREDDSRAHTRSGPEPWHHYATWPSEHYASPADPTQPKPPDGPPAAWSAPSPSSDSPDLETAVVVGRLVLPDSFYPPSRHTTRYPE